ncbi:MAG TPA: hypothetical protein PKW90_07585, partial [Myxococcota bacterium]|nr:hypothetical protein [Myxococcota bacterium]
SMLSDTGTEDLRVPVAAYRTCRVTAQSLTIRNSAGGQQTGILYNGDSFRRYSVSGSWAYGYAPRLNLWGYVMNGYLGGCA